jgi:hypothetical protein
MSAETSDAVVLALRTASAALSANEVADLVGSSRGWRRAAGEGVPLALAIPHYGHTSHITRFRFVGPASNP